jgi:hypothetical protein
MNASPVTRVAVTFALVLAPAIALRMPTPAAAAAAASTPVPAGTSAEELVWSTSGPPAGTAPQIADTTLAWDPDTGHAILYSGTRAPVVADSTWELSGGRWHSLSPATQPHVDPIGMTFDTDLGVLVLVGIDPHAAGPAQTWTFDGRDWRRMTGAGPGPLRAAAIAYDETTNSVVLFGGLDGGRPSDVTWVLHGTHWTSRTAQPAPPPLSDAAFAGDPGVDGLVLFGGSPNGASTWTWVRGSWRQVPAEPPVPAGRYALVTDASRQQAVLLGRDWSGAWHEAAFDPVAGSWDVLQPDWPSAPAVAAFGAFYDPTAQQVVVFGGAHVTGSDIAVWRGSAAEQPSRPCADIVSGGTVKTNATFASFNSSFGVELDGEALSNGASDVTMVADTDRGVELMIGYDGEVDGTTSKAGSGSGSGGSDGGKTSYSTQATVDLARENATGWKWHFTTVKDAQAFINGSAEQWTQHNLVQVVPIIGQWIADQTGQVQLPQATQDYVDNGTTFGLEASISRERGGFGATVGASFDASELTGGGVLFNQATGANNGATVDFELSQDLGINGSLGFSLSEAGNGASAGADYLHSETLTGETEYDASGAPKEFTLTSKSAGTLGGTASLDLWDWGKKLAHTKGNIELDATTGTATEHEISLPLDASPDAIPAVNAFLGAVNSGSPGEQARALGALDLLARKIGDDTLLSYKTTGGGASIGLHAGEILAFGAGGSFDNSVETLDNAQAWNSAAGTYTQWTACLAGQGPHPALVPPLDYLPGRISFELSAPGTGPSSSGLMNPDGTDVTALPSSMQPSLPQLSPDGRRLMFLGRSGHTIVVANLDGSAPQTIASSPDGLSSAVWSPTGGRIAYVAAKPSASAPLNHEIDVVDVKGGSKPRTVVDGVATPFGVSLAWSPDEKQLAFAKVAADVELVPVTGGAAARRIVDRSTPGIDSGAGDEPADLSWAPSSVILFDYLTLTGQSDVQAVDAGGKLVRSILPPGYTSVAWGPAGYFLAVHDTRVVICAYDALVRVSDLSQATCLPVGPSGVLSAGWGATG